MTPHGPGWMLAVIIGGAALVSLIVLLAPARHERSIYYERKGRRE